MKRLFSWVAMEFNAQIALFTVLTALVGSAAVNILAGMLNIRGLSFVIPKEFEGYYDAARYKKSQDYLREQTIIDVVETGFFAVLVSAAVLLHAFESADRAARHFLFGPIVTGLVFFLIVMLPFFLLRLPFAAYRIFAIEKRYGFNRMSFSTFSLDQLKSLALLIVLGGAVLAAVLWFFEKAGAWAWVYAWLCVFAFELFMAFVAPVAIMPLFNKFVPLPDCELRRAIEDFARAQNFQIQNIYSMDGSRRSSKANAMFAGFGRSRRVVLYDTLIHKHAAPELVGVLAHEIGHYRHGHILKFLAVSFVTTGFMFFFLSVLMRSGAFFAAFGVSTPSVYAGFAFFAVLWMPIDILASVFNNWLSRRFEYEADAFVVSSGVKPEIMIECLKKMSVDHLANLTPHPLKVLLGYGHPPILKRIDAIRSVV